MTLQRIEEPGELPVTVDDVLDHLALDDDSPQTAKQITRLIKAAVRFFEEYTGRALLRQRWQLRLDGFPSQGGAIGLERPPVLSVDRIEFIDTEMVKQTLDPECYELDPQSEIDWLVPAYGFVWPETLDKVNAVSVEFTTGFAAAGVVDENIQIALLLCIGHWFENREAVITGTTATSLPLGVEDLLAPYRVMRFA